MPKEPTKMGAPRKEIDWKEFDKLCQLQCTLEEIAGWFDCSKDNIRNKIKEKFNMTFSTYFEQKRAGGKISLRRMQFQTAEKGNAAMQIWLGKQYLGQTDKQEIAKEITQKAEYDYSKYTKEELDDLERLLTKGLIKTE